MRRAKRKLDSPEQPDGNSFFVELKACFKFHATNTLQLGAPAPVARRAFPRIFRLAGLSWRPRVRPARRVGSSHTPSQARPPVWILGIDPMCWEKYASSRSSIFRLHKNTLAPHLDEFLRNVLAVRAARDNHGLDRWDLQTDAVECVKKQRLRTHDFRKLFRPFIPQTWRTSSSRTPSPPASTIAHSAPPDALFVCPNISSLREPRLSANFCNLKILGCPRSRLTFRFHFPSPGGPPAHREDLVS